MEFVYNKIKGLVEIQPKVIQDNRGYFFESFRADKFEENGVPVNFVQANQSFSEKGVLRGLHLQMGEFAQAKLVKVVVGKVLDVAVDLRPGSETFGAWHSVLLDAERHNMFYIPEGFGHGFYTIEDAVFQYQCSNYYNKASESGVLWNDKDLAIDWQAEQPIVSEKDQILPAFLEFAKLV